ncbi:MAG TPA: hypothetical protein VLG69_01120 [Candidatus Andersenbacteria bacterium]|nr:hypothetical protein [Candidatus Andersenbacteria bacterium]
MTSALVADDVLGQIAIRQWELFSRVKKGTLNPRLVLRSLQALIENRDGVFSIERSAWEVSSKVYEISVSETENYVSEVKKLGFFWDHSTQDTFILKGSPKKKAKKVRIRLAQVESQTRVGVVRAFGENDGFDFATSWDLLAFMWQSHISNIVTPHTTFVAIGDFAEVSYRGIPDKKYIACISAKAGSCAGKYGWIFSECMYADNPVEMDRSRQIAVQSFILLKEKE